MENLLGRGANHVILGIPFAYRRFAAWDGVLPKVPSGVEILRCADYGPASKIIPTALAHPDADILYCDDDVLYGADWARELFAHHCAGQITAAQTFPAQRIGAVGTDARVAIGANGVVMSSADLPVFATTVPNACLFADDLWLSACFEKAGLDVKTVTVTTPPTHRPNDTFGLQDLDRAATYETALLEIREALGLW